MHIELRNERRERLFAIDVDISAPPAVVHAPVGDDDDDGTSPVQVVPLDWDRALDDELHLRHCPVCGCPDLFARKPMPQLTAFAVVVLAAVVAMVFYGIGQPMLGLALFIAVTVVDVAIYLFIKRELVCYRCRSTFSGLPIRRDHPRWDKAIGEQYPPPAPRDANRDQNEDGSGGTTVTDPIDHEDGACAR